MQEASRIKLAFERLASIPGFTVRKDQEQLANLISDCIDSSQTGAFEAPTGLGKSLGALIPAIAHALQGKRIVIATYTNVLAEQYWNNDLPLALSLFDFDGDIPLCQFLIGRQRYICLEALAQVAPSAYDPIRKNSILGIETDFRKHVLRSQKELNALWPNIAAPPVCPARLCPRYNDCYYYSARRGAEKALIVLTNHSVVLQDAQLKQASDGELSLLGDFDFLILDEAHDFPQAAQSALEFEFSESKLKLIQGLSGKLEATLAPIAEQASQGHEWAETCERFRQSLAAVERDLKVYGLSIQRSGILGAWPVEVWKHPQVAQLSLHDQTTPKDLSHRAGSATLEFVAQSENLLAKWRTTEGVNAGEADDSRDGIRNYGIYLREFAESCIHLLDQEFSDVSVTYAQTQSETILRHDVIGIANPLRTLIWDKKPVALMSATLALDGSFLFFNTLTGIQPDFEEILPTPFDFERQASVYLPAVGTIPDPSLARKSGLEENYYETVASELSKIIRATSGRTLALFHSRREMEAVFRLIDLPDDLPVLIQGKSGNAATGQRFLRETTSSLFALRSFWTGFDAPGETLSCLAIVRVPFEVPIDPTQVARMAWMQSSGLNPFQNYSLPMAKMMMRQGAGRLIRRTTDRGIIALLDPRLLSKSYGEEIIANLPSGMKVHRDIEEAVLGAGL